ncbi:hypothetical protein [Streptomyces sp. GESEQ-35]|uniref:hypothetical protein n=1 Tax=Streptomyces sp. GESEQ-35 TaxID=2812657 RepID=UPI001B325B0A|nr:hypothetical protein [Streptomyces sp. GESEQ-35]
MPARGFSPVVAAGVPAALDIYAVRALRVHRDVLAVVLAMIAVNAASHLVTAGLLPVSVPLVVAVSAIAPLVLWRVHALRDDVEVTTPTPRSTPAQVVTEVTAVPDPLPHARHAYVTSGMTTKVTTSVPAETGRPVTIERLRSELGLSRRDAAELRRDIVEGKRS